MTLYAHFAPNSSEVLDPREYPSLEAYKASFSGVCESRWSSHTFKEVPAGTKHGATDNGNGTYTAPPATPGIPGIYRWDEFNKYLIKLLNPDGRAKLQTLLEAARDKTGTTNADKNIRSFYTWYVGTTEFDKVETTEMLQYLVDGTIITSAQRNAVLNNWKEI